MRILELLTKSVFDGEVVKETQYGLRKHPAIDAIPKYASLKLQYLKQLGLVEEEAKEEIDELASKLEAIGLNQIYQD